MLLHRYDCNNSTGQVWEIYSGLTQVQVADEALSTKFCIDAKTGECCYYLNGLG